VPELHQRVDTEARKTRIICSQQDEQSLSVALLSVRRLPLFSAISLSLSLSPSIPPSLHEKRDQARIKLTDCLATMLLTRHTATLTRSACRLDWKTAAAVLRPSTTSQTRPPLSCHTLAAGSRFRSIRLSRLTDCHRWRLATFLLKQNSSDKRL